MGRRRRVPVSFTVLLVVALLAPLNYGARAGAQPRAVSPSNKIAPQLRRAFEKDPVRQFVVEFAGNADLPIAGSIKGFTQRGRFVLRSLAGTAARAQAEARRLVARTKGAQATSFWITNVMVV